MSTFRINVRSLQHGSKGGYTLKELCKEFKLDPKRVRKALREIDFPKPGAQWTWPNKAAAQLLIDLLSGKEITLPDDE